MNKKNILTLNKLKDDPHPQSLRIAADWVHFPIEHTLHPILTRCVMRQHMRDILHITNAQAQDLLSNMLSTLVNIIATSKVVKLSSFGTFLIHDKKARLGRNPKTKEEVVVTPRHSVSFRASPILKDAVNTKRP